MTILLVTVACCVVEIVAASVCCYLNWRDKRGRP